MTKIIDKENNFSQFSIRNFWEDTNNDSQLVDIYLETVIQALKNKQWNEEQILFQKNELQKKMKIDKKHNESNLKIIERQELLIKLHKENLIELNEMKISSNQNNNLDLNLEESNNQTIKENVKLNALNNSDSQIINTVENNILSDEINSKLVNKTKRIYDKIRVEQLEKNKILEVRNLHVSFPTGKKKSIHIVRGIDLDVYKAQIVGLVGESGSGKSVTSKTLINVNHNGIIDADKIQINDLELTKIKKSSQWQYIRGKKIGYIPQDPLTSLNPTRTIGKQLLDALNTNIEWSKKSYISKKTYLIDLLKQFGLRNAEQIFYQYPHTLSGGMKQRIVITMVVALKPDIIIADEPTTALDPTVQASVLSLFENIRQQYNISIILISHNISVIAKFCDYIYVMYAGKIVEKGTKKEIFTNPAHPYTWALISAIPETKDEKLYNIKGTPPDMANLPLGDPFAPRNEYALEIDFVKEPPLIPITSSHAAATWLLHPEAPKVTLSDDLIKRLNLFKETFKEYE
ncbi:ABC transporter ATP-binding protein [Mycoplasma sp. 744]|uniref:ABC transporter ATP-binding protein n=1 Tax=Mycoplasma sp. 744 TaxID=3108531 RepID=UPI002B1D0D28|nr:ABC transporter ATP-binding protein [Mycoplasma sp. 744]MEA4115398.1 ABC transporter ATP-binding protein [Mycoplasma sp. 744]